VDEAYHHLVVMNWGPGNASVGFAAALDETDGYRLVSVSTIGGGISPNMAVPIPGSAAILFSLVGGQALFGKRRKGART
jgi:hypothetical protein